jgi:type IV fimbrial biogenesis protein FimT
MIRTLSNTPSQQSGVTLIELMVTISIVAILLAIGVPSYKYVTVANRTSSEVNGLLGDMQYARSEAIKEGQAVVVCSSKDQATCAGSSSWATGWIVFSDLNGNGSYDAGEPVLRVQGALSSSGDTLAADQNTKAVSFNREGFAPGANIVTVTLHDSTSNQQWTRCLKISTVGMLMTTRYSAATTPTWPGPCT